MTRLRDWLAWAAVWTLLVQAPMWIAVAGRVGARARRPDARCRARRGLGAGAGLRAGGGGPGVAAGRRARRGFLRPRRTGLVSGGSRSWSPRSRGAASRPRAGGVVRRAERAGRRLRARGGGTAPGPRGTATATVAPVAVVVGVGLALSGAFLAWTSWRGGSYWQWQGASAQSTGSAWSSGSPRCCSVSPLRGGSVSASGCWPRRGGGRRRPRPHRSPPRGDLRALPGRRTAPGSPPLPLPASAAAPPGAHPDACRRAVVAAIAGRPAGGRRPAAPVRHRWLEAAAGATLEVVPPVRRRRPARAGVVRRAAGARRCDGRQRRRPCPWLARSRSWSASAGDGRSPRSASAWATSSSPSPSAAGRPNPLGQPVGLLATGWTDAAAATTRSPRTSPPRRGVQWNDDVVTGPPRAPSCSRESPAGELQVARFAPDACGACSCTPRSTGASCWPGPTRDRADAPRARARPGGRAGRGRRGRATSSTPRGGRSRDALRASWPAGDARPDHRTGQLVRLGFQDVRAAPRRHRPARRSRREPLLAHLGRPADPDLALAGLLPPGRRGRGPRGDAGRARRRRGHRDAAAARSSAPARRSPPPRPAPRALARAHRPDARHAPGPRRTPCGRPCCGPSAPTRTTPSPVAGLPDAEAVDALRVEYRRILLRLAARDLAHHVGVDDAAAELADLAAGTLDAALAVARARVGDERRDAPGSPWSRWASAAATSSTTSPTST